MVASFGAHRQVACIGLLWSVPLLHGRLDRAGQSTRNGWSMDASATQLLDAIDGWAAAGGPLYEALATAVGGAIADGRLTEGTRLPPERRLAAALAVSRSTVAAALELLEQRGLVTRRQGAGTYVRGVERSPADGRRALVSELDDHALLRDLSGRPEASIELLAAAVPCAPEVRSAVADLDDAALRGATAGHGYVPLGLPALREAIAAHLRAGGLPTTPDQIAVTTGAVEAVLLAGRLFLEPGDEVVVEAPSYIGALDVLRSIGARLQGVEVDGHGARTDQLAGLLARGKQRMAYLIPDFHNPTGWVLSGARRREVARLAAEHRIPVVEDLVQHELWFDAEPPPPIATIDPDAPVLTLGSMSKVFWGGLRIGWIRADPTTIERIGRLKTVTNYGTPTIDQLASARLLPQLPTIAARRRGELRTRLARLEAALLEHLPDWRWRTPAGGLSLWVGLPTPDAPALVRAADRHGVAVATGASFGLAPGDHRDHVRLPFVADPDVIAEGVRRLAAAWDDVAQGRDRGPRRAVVV
jgi:DNA-binding transcriptional MocR family regulator